MPVIIAYIAALFASVVNLYLLSIVMKRQKSGYFALLFFITTVVCIAYLAISVSRSAEEALLATKLTYLGGTFLIFILLLCMCQICGIRPKAWWTLPLYVMDLEVMVVVAMTGFVDWHYKSVELVHKNGYSYLIKEYGFHHDIYIGVMMVSFCVAMVLVIYAFLHRKKSSWIYTLFFGIGMALNIFLSLFQRAIGLEVDLMPFSYVVMEVLIILILKRIETYDVAATADKVTGQLNSQGYVIVDNVGTFIGADDVARFYFPELNEISLDTQIDRGFLNDEFRSWIIESRFADVPYKIFRRKDREVKVTVNPFYNNSGKKQLGYMIKITDDTQTQNYIRQLQEANREAEEQAARADAANRSKSVFLSNMSHEIRTPINAVLGLNEMILRETTEEPIRAYALDIESAGNTLMELINDLLDLSKIEAGKMELVPVRYSITNLLNDIINMISIRAEDKGLQFIVDISPKIPRELYGDEIRVKQILMNILVNAVKYTEKGSVTLKLDCAPAGEGYITINAAVTDTGIGLKPESIERIFAPFERVDEMRNRKVEGTGLGLAITQKMLDLMGSHLEVQSVYEQGSTFSFGVIQHVEDATPIGDFERAKAELHKRDDTYQAKLIAENANVLVVDDTKVNIRVFVGLVKQIGLKVDGAYSGREALRMCSEKKYDLIYMDHMMPEMDGVEAFRHIREDADSLNKDTCVVIMTANAISGAREEYMQLGFDGYISKPIRPQILEQSLIDHLPKDKFTLEKEEA